MLTDHNAGANVELARIARRAQDGSCCCCCCFSVLVCIIHLWIFLPMYHSVTQSPIQLPSRPGNFKTPAYVYHNYITHQLWMSPCTGTFGRRRWTLASGCLRSGRRTDWCTRPPADSYTCSWSCGAVRPPVRTWPRWCPLEWSKAPGCTRCCAPTWCRNGGMFGPRLRRRAW